MTRPALSICVPSRNRQRTFVQTIRDLLANPRPDVEFVLVDNSDDPTIVDAVVTRIPDSRIRYVPSAEHVLPMQDNWERAMQAATGDWITFIGDDDYVDPDVIDTILEIARRRPEVDAIGWSRLGFQWPDYRPFSGNACVALGNSVHLVNRDDQMRQLFHWHGAAPIPKVAFSVYHGAVRRSAMEKIHTHFSGCYFEHPTVDFECACKLLMTGREFVYVDRPFSVLGATAASNSSAVGRFGRVGEINAALAESEGPRFDAPDFPFTSRLGVAASIMATLHWFSTRYGVAMQGWETSFLKALAIDCGRAEDRESYEAHVAACHEAIAGWQGGIWMDAFRPRFMPLGRARPFTGLRGTTLFIDESAGDCATPAEFYALTQSILPPVEMLHFAFDSVSGAAGLTAAA